MLGYLNAESPFTDDGWFITGDMVERDGEYLRFMGRQSEIINVGGQKVFPAEVENVIQDMDSVGEVTVYGAKNAIVGNIVCARVSLTSDEAREKGVGILKRVGLGERVSHKPYELSGGQQQRVAVARAFANDPAIILADEPTGNLDLNTGTEIIELLREMNQESGVTVISATHDHKMLSVSDRVVWVSDGMVERIINRDELTIEVGTIDGVAE